MTIMLTIKWSLCEPHVVPLFARAACPQSPLEMDFESERARALGFCAIIHIAPRGGGGREQSEIRINLAESNGGGEGWWWWGGEGTKRGHKAGAPRWASHVEIIVFLAPFGAKEAAPHDYDIVCLSGRGARTREWHSNRCLVVVVVAAATPNGRSCTSRAGHLSGPRPSAARCSAKGAAEQETHPIVGVEDALNVVLVEPFAGCMEDARTLEEVFLDE